MLEAYGQALSFLFQPVNLLLIAAAVIAGLVFGIMPGIGGMTGLALFLPFLFGIPAEAGLFIMMAFLCVVYTGGSVSAILLNIPGTNPNAATLLDGFPMNQKGEGARAIGAAVTASMFGGLAPVFLSLIMIPLLRPIIMAFKSPEMAILIVVGLSFISTLTGRSKVRGICSGALGILFSLIGFQAGSGINRFTFGSFYLSNGLGIVSVALGLFGLSEMLDMTMKGQATIAIRKVEAKLSEVLRGAIDVWRHKWLWFRSTLIGYIIGVIPGIGGEAAIFVAYGNAKQTSKHPETFGTGNVEGVIAPESANNAIVSGSLLTTMAFGIPGSASMAIFMSALLLVGVVPGPRMLIDHLPLALIMILGVALANIIAGLVTLATAPYLVRVASIRLTILFPAILCVVLVGSFADHRSMADIIVLIVFGLLGLFMRMHHFSRPAFLLGFVMGKLLEQYTFLSISLSGPFFFVTPLSLTLLGILVILYAYPYLKKVPGLVLRGGR